MVIAFYNPISAPFHNSIRAAPNFNEMIDCYVENVNESVDVILYLGKEKKSSHLLRKFFFELLFFIFFDIYRTGFRDCFYC